MPPARHSEIVPSAYSPHVVEHALGQALGVQQHREGDGAVARVPLDPIVGEVLQRGVGAGEWPSDFQRDLRIRNLRDHDSPTEPTCDRTTSIRVAE